MWLVIIACVAFAQAAPAQIPVIEPSDSLGVAGNADIDDRTIALTAGLGLSELRVFERSGSGDWVQVATLLSEEEFGFSSVALHDSMAIAISASAVPPECFLNVFARRHGTWQRVQKLPYCGFRLAVGPRLAAVSHVREVHVFRRNPDDTLEFETSLSSVGTDLGFVEPPVAIANDTVWVGDPAANDGRGVVHVFEEAGGNWVTRTTLTASDPESRGFGRRLQTRGNIALINADSSAYVFERVGRNWDEQTRLFSTDPSTFLFDATLVDRHRVAVQIGTGEGVVTRYLARLGGTGGWTPIARLGDVLDDGTTIDATRGFVLSFEEGSRVFVYDVRGWQ
jgi:hypothetical protein